VDGFVVKPTPFLHSQIFDWWTFYPNICADIGTDDSVVIGLTNLSVLHDGMNQFFFVERYVL
jgi:hypothetical protein